MEATLAAGKEARSAAPRSSHADWQPADDLRDPVELLEEQGQKRVQELLPIRYGRMSASAFAFFRGGAYVMASDLATTPQTGIRVQLCGDAHLSNFGGFASPERDLVFDLNDFDETLPGPWEWDLKRLAASVVVAARERGFDAKMRRRIVTDTAARYRSAIRGFAAMGALDTWYARISEEEVASLRTRVAKKQTRNLDKTIAKGRSKDSSRAFAKLATEENGGVRILADPPLIVPIEDIAEGADARAIEEGVHGVIRSYQESLAGERRRLVDRFHYAHAARKVVGVGSVGTRAWVVLMLGRDSGEPLFLQAKEAGPSVLERFAGESEYDNEGQRVVEGQRLMQCASDILLGWLRTEGVDGQTRDFYVRQLWDWKTSPVIEQMVPSGMGIYAQMCAWTLARAHARSGDASAIAAYLGSSDTFDRAIAEFSERYADQNERDYRALLDAIESGRIEAAAADR